MILHFTLEACVRQTPQTSWITGAHGSQNELERSIQIMQWFCFGAIEKNDHLQNLCKFSWECKFFLVKILGHLKLPQLYPSDQRPEVWWLWLHRCFGWHELEKPLGRDGKRNHAMPPFLWKLPWKKMSRKEAFPDVPAWYVALWNALLVSWWPMESGFGGFLHLVPTQTVDSGSVLVFSC